MGYEKKFVLQKSIRRAFFIGLSFIIVSCDHIPKRSEGSCVSSYYYGGPFRIKKT